MCLVAALQGEGQRGTPGMSDGESENTIHDLLLKLTQQTEATQSKGFLHLELSLEGRTQSILLQKILLDFLPRLERQTHTEATKTVANP